MWNIVFCLYFLALTFVAESDQLLDADNPSQALGYKAAIESNGIEPDEVFLLFKEKGTWHDAQNYCKDTWGELAVPNTIERHDLIGKLSVDGALNESADGMWLGMTDIETEGVWKFSNDELVNFAPDFGDLTVGGKIQLYSFNTTSVDERWHFYYAKNASFFLNYTKAVLHCDTFGGHLPIITTLEENDRMAYHLKRFKEQWYIDFPWFEAFPNRHHFPHLFVWLGINRPYDDIIEKFKWVDGTPTRFPDDWYLAHRKSIQPNIVHHFERWLYPPDPNNLKSDFEGRLCAECCATLMIKQAEWVDLCCGWAFHVVCELGPFDFERWHNGGNPSAEPNDAGGNEDCGALRLDVNHLDLALDHTGAKYDHWNDYPCDSEQAFACQITLPEQCATYNPPLTESCIVHYSQLAGCDPDVLPRNVMDAISKTLTAIGTRNLFRKAFARRNEGSIFEEICTGSVFKEMLPGVMVKFHLLALTWKEANEKCQEDASKLISLKNEEFADKISAKLMLSGKVLDLLEYHIGMDRHSGYYRWSTSEAVTLGYQNFNGQIEDFQQCVVINIVENAKWTEIDCMEKAPFICYIPIESPCLSAMPPLSLSCLLTIWELVGCTPEGEKFPENLEEEELERLSAFYYTGALAETQNIEDNANSGDEQAMLDCHGMVYPGNCTDFDPPHPVNCMETMWLNSGCTAKGTWYPATLTETQFINAYSVRNLRQVKEEHHDVLYKHANKNSKNHQKMCYGFEFPAFCTVYIGPHSRHCLNSMWKQAKCWTDGEKYPEKITEAEVDGYNTMNINQVIANMSSLKASADAGDEQAQVHCYGFALPDGCTSYTGPHTVECLNALWLEIGCDKEGRKFPGSLADISTMSKTNLRTLKVQFEHTHKEANRGQQEDQRDCYGFVFPTECFGVGLTLLPPTCIIGVWNGVGCKEEGKGFFNVLEPPEKKKLQNTQIIELFETFRDIHDSALSGNVTDQLECFGFEFPEECEAFEPALSKECVAAVWLETGCLEEGNEYPLGLSQNDFLNKYQHLNLQQVRLEIAELHSRADTQQDAQKQCYGRTFPEGCKGPTAPHSIECLDNIWVEVCLAEGNGLPSKRPDSDSAALSALSYTEIVSQFEATRTSALANDSAAQESCYGLVFPAYCSTYLGPHSLECLNFLWKKNGCLEDGTKFPETLAQNDFSALASKNIREVEESVSSLRSDANQGNAESQLSCFGFVFPEDCVKFDPILSVPCLKSIWKEAGCLPEGDKFMDKLDSAQLTEFRNQDLTSARLIFEGIHERANQNNVTEQLNCFGIEYPESCETYYAMLTAECLATIWVRAGCLEEGRTFPTVLSSSALYDTYKDKNQKQAEEAIKTLISETADNKEKQKDCYGKVFPDGCTTYEGVHNTECLDTVFKTNCLVEGNKLPSKLTNAELADIKVLNLEELEETNEMLKNLSATDSDAQMGCYGIEFPSNCTTYDGPHSVDCLNTMFIEAGCKDVGHKYPGSLSQNELSSLASNDLRRVQRIMALYSSNALAGSQTDQYNCYGLKFPTGCSSFEPPLSDECIETVWLEAGCLKDGDLFIKNLDEQQSAKYKQMNLKTLIDEYEATHEKALDGNDTSQMECFGLEFLEGCEFYLGTLPVECVTAIWLEVGCLEEGTLMPSLMTEDVFMSNYEGKNIRDVTAKIQQLKDGARTDTVSQKECFGKVLPAGCTSFEGPHSVDCLSETWKESGCLAEGEGYPEKLSDEQIEKMSTLNISAIQSNVASTVAASATNATEQLNCYGIEFPDNCTLYDGPNTRDCLNTIWKKVGCNEEGEKYPSKLTQEEFEPLSTANLRQVEADMKQTWQEANSGQYDQQLECYGFEFPDRCSKFIPLLTVACIKSAWKTVGCTEDGDKFMDKLSSDQLSKLQNKDLKSILTSFNETHQSAVVQANTTDQKNCFGLEFFENCDTFVAPLSVDCITTIWLEVGCVEAGKKFPGTQSEADIQAEYGGLTQREIRDKINKLILDSETEKEKQLECYGFALPTHCKGIAPPHSTDCLNSAWKEVGCLEVGEEYPEKRPDSDIETLATKDLREVTSLMNDTRNAADNDDQAEQQNCYGLELPGNCTNYHGPHEIDCLSTIWKEIGCTTKGQEHPQKLSFSVAENLMKKNIRQIQDNMNTTWKEANSGNVNAQMDCYGIVFPEGCLTFDPILDVPCIKGAWLKAGCVEEGGGYMDNLTEAELDVWKNKNIPSLQNSFNGTFSDALDNDAAAQLNCFGMNFYDNCTQYHGTLSTECLTTIWLKAGCYQEGTKIPQELSQKQLEEYDGLNQREAYAKVRSLKSDAESGDMTKQEECFGIEFYENCETFYGVHSLECLMTIWKELGCLVEGTASPDNLTSAELTKLSNMNLIDLTNDFNKTRTGADSNIVSDQEKCFGKVYPDGCLRYYPPLSLECLTTIWTQENCLEDGKTYPKTLGYENSLKLWGDLDQREVTKDMSDIKAAADSGDAESQAQCFGQVFPKECPSYYGPHSLECLSTVWGLVGCLTIGEQFPANLTVERRNELSAMNYSFLFTNFETIKNESDSGNATQQKNCFGKEYYPNCSTYYPELSQECIATIWLHTGCDALGTNYPMNLSLETVNSYWGSQSQGEVTSSITEEPLNPALDGDKEQQMLCWGIVLPEHCADFKGPHTIECYRSIWKESKCLPEGFKAPDNLTTNEIAELDKLNVRDVLENMTRIKNAADDNSTTDQLNCFGMEYYDNCSTYYEVLPVKCLNSIWTSGAGCSDKGTAYPGNTYEDDVKSYRSFDQREALKRIKGTREAAESGDKNFQKKCFGIELPDNCTFYPPHDDDCLSEVWTKIIGAAPEGTYYPPKLNSSYKQMLFDDADLHEVIQLLNEITNETNNHIKSFGMELPEGCEFYPPHSDFCIEMVFEKAGCDEILGKVPPTRNETYKTMQLNLVLEEFQTFQRNAANDSLSGVESEICHEPDYVKLAENFSVLVVHEKLNYTGALAYCREQRGYLLHEIVSSEHQALIEEKLRNAEELFGVTTWWLGLDDKKVEGQFEWNTEVQLLQDDYENWSDRVPVSHPSEDCSILDAEQDFKWDVEDCLATHSFMCHYLKCGFPPVETVEVCDPPCHTNENCLNATCHCAGIFSADNCSWAGGMDAVLETKEFGKTFLFFEEKANWHQSLAFCEDTWGTLVIPSNLERHDFIVETSIDLGFGDLAQAMWLGMSDWKAEGNWTFTNGELVNYAPVFGDLTGKGKLKNYIHNTTSIDERWHFYYNESNLVLNHSDATTYCGPIGAHLPIVRDEAENDRICRFYLSLIPRWRVEPTDIMNPYHHNFLWMAVTRKEGSSIETFKWSDGVSVYMEDFWYVRRSLPIPPEKKDTFVKWLGEDPNNQQRYNVFEDRTMGEFCLGLAMSEQRWIDVGCWWRLHVVCELGPYPFERWHNGGNNNTEPTDAWCREDCGALRFDLPDLDFTGTYYEYWNDFACNKNFTFACESELPPPCPTYMPPLEGLCVKHIADKFDCDSSKISETVLDFLVNETLGTVQVVFRNLLYNSDDSDSIINQICEDPKETNFPGNLKLKFHLKAVTYAEAEKICEGEGSVLATLQNNETANAIYKYIHTSPIIGIKYWWFGLTDREVETLYEWSGGDPLDKAAGHLIDFGDSFVSTPDEDCGAIDVVNDMDWVMQDCTRKNAFICVKVTCDYPIKYELVHRDECYHIRHDPRNLLPSVYTKGIEKAEENCGKSHGRLSLADDEVTKLFLHDYAIRHKNVPFNYTSRFWVSLYDVPENGRIDATKRNWFWKDEDGVREASKNETKFIHDEFKMENVGIDTSERGKLTYVKRCLYGDHENHTYGLPLETFTPHYYARSKSCAYNHPHELTWVWTSNYHLLHLHSGRCLTAPYEMVDKTDVALSPGIRIMPCDLTDNNQQWICETLNPFHLKLRKRDYSIIYDKIEPFDRAYMAGTHYRDSCRAFWRTLMSNKYLCDPRYHPGHNLFFAHPGPVVPPSKEATKCSEVDLEQKSFADEVDKTLACHFQGGRMALLADLVSSLSTGFVDGCHCGTVDQAPGVSMAVSVYEDERCEWRTGAIPNKNGIVFCSSSRDDSVWCYRGSKNANIVNKVQYNPWCGTFSLLAPNNYGLEERSCLQPHYFACKKKTNNTCEAAAIPANGYTTREDWTVGGDGVRIFCNAGHGLAANPLELSVNLTCVKSAGVKSWDPDPTLLECLPLPCPDPAAAVSSTMTSDPPNIASGDFKYKDRVTYTCDEGLAINGNAKFKTFSSVCRANQKWKPSPTLAKCKMIQCSTPPRVFFSKAIYDPSNNTLSYECWKGYWIERGVHNVTGFVCNTSGHWHPEPLHTVSCVALSCEVPELPPNAERFSVTSYRYLANLTINCVTGFTVVPNSLQITCNEKGIWEPSPNNNWCQNVTCAIPEEPEQPLAMVSGLKKTYIYLDSVEYKCNKTGYGLRKGFVIYSPQYSTCLSTNDAGKLFLSSRCDSNVLNDIWVWYGLYNIRSVYSGDCIADLSGTVELQKCDTSKNRQKWECPVLLGNNLLIAVKGSETLLRIKEGTPEAAGGPPDTSASWMAGVKSSKDVCTKQAVYMSLETICTKAGLWNLPHDRLKCSVQQCRPLPEIEGAIIEKSGEGPPIYGTTWSYKCKPGTWMGFGKLQADLTCDATGTWMPAIDVVHCVQLICNPPAKVKYTMQTGIKWNFESVITYTCFPGYWMTPGEFERDTRCSAKATWQPDPETEIKCEPIMCLDPGKVAHATYNIAVEKVAHDFIIQYKCDPGYWFERGKRSIGVRCTDTGLFEPKVSTLRCERVTCFPPGPVVNAHFGRKGNEKENIRGKAFQLDAVVVYSCKSLFEISPGVFQQRTVCSETGDWSIDPASIICYPTVCPEPNFVANAEVTGQGLTATSTRTYECHKGFWIEQEADLKMAVTRCEPLTAKWDPPDTVCRVAYCRDPGMVKNAERIKSPDPLVFGEELVYKCKKGFAMVGGSFDSFYLAVCQEDSTWQPDPRQAKCNPLFCKFTVDHYDHGTITFPKNYKGKYNDIVTLTCDKGYWAMLDKGQFEVEFICMEDGYYQPTPIYVSCVVLECPTPPPKLHAHLEASHVTYRSMITYTCAEGFASVDGPEPVFQWNITCGSRADWNRDFNEISCKLVDCGNPPPAIGGYSEDAEITTYSSQVKYTCFEGRWIKPGVYSETLTCKADMTWDKDPSPCEAVVCKDPLTVTQHATLIGREFTFASLVTVRCKDGYRVQGLRRHATIRCLATGVWDLDEDEFTCKAVMCPPLPDVTNAISTAARSAVGSLANFTCIDNYYVSRTSKYVTVRCNEDGRWIPAPRYVKCLHKSDFLCDMPPPKENTFYMAEGYGVGQRMEVRCDRGMWFYQDVFVLTQQCYLNGTWLPDISEHTCFEVMCSELPSVQNSEYIGTSRIYNSVVHLSCTEGHHIYRTDQGVDPRQVTSVALICDKDGTWYPEPSFLSCVRDDAEKGCGRIFAHHSMTVSNHAATALRSNVQLSCKEGKQISYGVVSATVYCTETGLWQPSIGSLVCHATICGIPITPENGYFVGKDTRYRGEMKFRCAKSFGIPTEAGYVTELTLTCNADGSWQNIGQVDDCKAITCPDPGNLDRSYRSPVSKKDFAIGARVKFTCRSGMRFIDDLPYKEIFCNSDGKWLPGKAIDIIMCVEVMCWPPPHIPHTLPDSKAERLHRFDERFLYVCDVGKKYSIEPSNRDLHHSIVCLSDASWSSPPNGFECEDVRCDAPPVLKHTTLAKVGNMLSGSSVIYKCDWGYLVQVTKDTYSIFFESKCSSMGAWEPDPRTFKCEDATCPLPTPDPNSHGSLPKGTYAVGDHVTFTCDVGYHVRGQGHLDTKVKLECRRDGTWSYGSNSTMLSCEIVSCDLPPPIDNSTLTNNGSKYGDMATYVCLDGHFLNPLRRTGKNIEDMLTSRCTIQAEWAPSPNSRYCEPFDCQLPSKVKNAKVSFPSTLLHSTATYQCDMGYVIDHGEDGYSADGKPLPTTITSSCDLSLAWTPSPNNIKCALIQCKAPVAPRLSSIRGGRRVGKGVKVYRYGDEATMSCRPGFYIKDHGNVSMSLFCLHNGTWSVNLTMVQCVDLTCPNLRPIAHASQSGDRAQYMSRVTYTCNDGYFIGPGVTRITVECTHTRAWRPAISFTCKAVECGDPGPLHRAQRDMVLANYGPGTSVTYTCAPGSRVARERDAVGEWLVDHQGAQTIRVTCANDGRWRPGVADVHCSDLTTGTTLYDLLPDGEVLNPLLADLVLREEDLSFQQFGRSVGGSESKLALECENPQEILFVDHLGQWVHITSPQVSTIQKPTFLIDTGDVCEVSRMVDGNPNTYWQPDEKPFAAWRGWTANIDLLRKHVIGSFRLHSSRNQKNDVKTFYIHASPDGLNWKMLGPFHCLVGHHTIEFFYNFEVFQARFIKLNITATALMHTPVVTKFGVFGATFVCSPPIVLESDSYVIPAFTIAVLVTVLVLLVFAARKDQKNRWKRYILTTPFDDQQSSLRHFVYEVCLTTAWKRSDVDLLLKVHGRNASTSIIWLRSDFPGIMRPGFTDTIAVRSFAKIGYPVRIDLVLVTRTGEFDLCTDEDQKGIIGVLPGSESNSAGSRDLLLGKNSRNTSQSSAGKSRSTPGEYIYGFGGLTLRNPVTEEKWIAQLPTNHKGGIGFLYSSHVGLEHGIPITCPLSSPMSESSTFFLAIFAKNLWICAGALYRHHPLVFLFQNSASFVIRNLLGLEKVLYSSTALLHSLLMAAILRGFGEAPIYFVSERGGSSSIFDQSSVFSHLTAALFSAFAIAMVLMLLGRPLAGKWRRRVECGASYWQGYSPLRAFFGLLFGTLGTLGRFEQDADSLMSLGLGSNLDPVKVDPVSCADQQGDLVGYLDRSLKTRNRAQNYVARSRPGKVKSAEVNPSRAERSAIPSQQLLIAMETLMTPDSKEQSSSLKKTSTKNGKEKRTKVRSDAATSRVCVPSGLGPSNRDSESDKTRITSTWQSCDFNEECSLSRQSRFKSNWKRKVPIQSSGLSKYYSENDEDTSAIYQRRGNANSENEGAPTSSEFRLRNIDLYLPRASGLKQELCRAIVVSKTHESGSDTNLEKYCDLNAAASRTSVKKYMPGEAAQQVFEIFDRDESVSSLPRPSGLNRASTDNKQRAPRIVTHRLSPPAFTDAVLKVSEEGGLDVLQIDDKLEGRKDSNSNAADPTHRPVGRITLALLCVLYTGFATAHLIVEGQACSHGAAGALLSSFFVDIALLLLFVMPLAGWTAWILEVLLFWLSRENNTSGPNCNFC